LLTTAVDGYSTAGVGGWSIIADKVLVNKFITTSVVSVLTSVGDGDGVGDGHGHGDGDGLCKKGSSDHAMWCHMIDAMAYSICVG